MSAAGVPRIESLDMAGRAGILEGILRLPAVPPSRAALLCHLHPLYQGSLHSDDVRTALDALCSRVPGVPVALVGYSFGSRVGFEAAAGDSRAPTTCSPGISAGWKRPSTWRRHTREPCVQGPRCGLRRSWRCAVPAGGAPSGKRVRRGVRRRLTGPPAFVDNRRRPARLRPSGRA